MRTPPNQPRFPLPSPSEPSPSEPSPSEPSPSQPPRGRRLRRWFIELALALALFSVVSAWQSRALPIGEPAPPFELLDLNGTRTSLEQFRGKRSIVHFWATWCGVCRAEIDTLKSFAHSLGDDAALLTVVADSDDVVALRRFVEERGIDYPVLLGTDEVLKAFQIRAFPTHFYIDSQGRIDNATVGYSPGWAIAARSRCAR